MQHGTIRLVLALAASTGAAAVVACSSSNKGPTPSSEQSAETQGANAPEQGTQAQPPPQQRVVCSPGQAVAILDALNDVGLADARVGATWATDNDVRAFAQQLVDEHTKLSEQLRGMAGQSQDMSPVPNDISNAIQFGHQFAVPILQTKVGPEFDQFFLAHEVLAHAKAVGLLDTLIGPAAANAQFGGMLNDLRGRMVDHANTALTLEANLRGVCGTPTPPACSAPGPSGGGAAPGPSGGGAAPGPSGGGAAPAMPGAAPPPSTSPATPPAAPNY